MIRLARPIGESVCSRPFPTLVDALKNVDADVGFNVEVKYPMVQAVRNTYWTSVESIGSIG